MSLEITTARLDAAPEVATLCDSERWRAVRLATERLRTRFIVARATLRRLLAQRVGVRPQEIEFLYGPHGKPSLSARFESEHLSFNLSHCDDLAVYAFSSDGDVGVDVEAVRWFADADDVAARMFSLSERDSYAALDPLDRPAAFFNCWTRKEAFIKADGKTFLTPLDSFDVSLAPGQPAQILRVGNTSGERCGWTLQSFTPAPGFVAAVVAQDHER